MDYFNIDLHIHTPSSSDYFNKSEKEYLSIIKSAVENGLHIIAISDHFSVRGFEYIMNKKKEAQTTYSMLMKRGDASQEYLNQIDEEIKLFTKIHILLGLELDINGIHFIIVFSESVSTGSVEEFLLEITSNTIMDKFGDADFVLCKSFQDVVSLMNSKFGENYFIYAPHIDSSKGLYDGLKESKQIREIIFNDDNLLAISVNKENSREYLRNNYISNLKRTKPLNIIQESDYHGKKGQQIGQSYFLIEDRKVKPSFKEILKSFNSRVPIKTSLDIAKAEYDNFCKENSPILDVDANDENDFAKKSCAVLNSKQGLLRIDMQIDQDIDPKSQIEDTIKNLVEILSKKLNLLDRYIFHQVFQLGKGKIIVIIRFKKINRLILYQEKAFIINSIDNSVGAGNANEVESIVARNIYNRFAKPKDNLIRRINRNSNKVKNYLLSFSIFYKIQNQLKMYENIEIDFHENSDTEPTKLQEIIDIYNNGHSDGNLVYLTDLSKIDYGRLKNINSDDKVHPIERTYLRVTAPIISYPNDEDIEDLYETKCQEIVIVPGGGSFLVPAFKKIYSYFPFFSLKAADQNTDSDLEFFIGYFKSSFFQWFISKIYTFEEIFDFFLNNMHRKLPFIYSFDSTIKNQIKNDIKNTINDEEKFLRDYSKKIKSNAPSKDISECIKKHNQNCERSFNILDKHLFENLMLEKDEIIQILNDMKDLDIYDYKALEKFYQIYN